METGVTNTRAGRAGGGRAGGGRCSGCTPGCGLSRSAVSSPQDRMPWPGSGGCKALRHCSESSPGRREPGGASPCRPQLLPQARGQAGVAAFLPRSLQEHSWGLSCPHFCPEVPCVRPVPSMFSMQPPLAGLAGFSRRKAPGTVLSRHRRPPTGCWSSWDSSQLLPVRPWQWVPRAAPVLMSSGAVAPTAAAV